MKIRNSISYALSSIIYALIGVIHVIASVRYLILRIIVFAILFVPTIFYMIKQELGFNDTIALYRREYIALFSLDVAISQHFFILSGYFVAAVCIAYLGSLFGSFSTLEALQPWVTIATVSGGSTATIISVLLGIYGAVGVGIVASLIISTYSRVLDQIPRSDSDLVRYLAENLEQNGNVGLKDIKVGEVNYFELNDEIASDEIDDDTSLHDALDSLDLDYTDEIDEDTITDLLDETEFNGDMWETLAERKLDSQDRSEITNNIRTIIGENLNQLIESGYLGSPTYKKLWIFIRTRDPWAQDHPLLSLESEQQFDIKKDAKE